MYNVLDYLKESARKYPDKVAFADIDQSITYEELYRKAQEIGSALASKISIGQPVPIFMEKSVDTICLFFGVVYAGGFYVLLDMKQPQTRLNHIMKTLDSKMIVTSQKYIEALKKKQMESDVILLEDLYGHVNLKKLDSIASQHTDTMPLYTIFTSGSTGIPKGVCVAHRSVIDFIETFTKTFHINENDVIGNQAPWDFDVSVKDIYSTIKTGATMQIIPRQYFSIPTQLLDFLCEREVTTIIWAVSAVCIISTLKGFEYKVPHKISKVMFSGEVMPMKQLRIWRSYLPDTMYVNLYGPTEITCNCAYHIISQMDQDDVIPIGKAFQNEKVFLLDEHNQEVIIPDVLGEICVSGTAVSLGYYNNPQQTHQAFCQNPLNPYYREIIYRTGDLGYYNKQGELCFASRKDFQIKHMGHRIELGEIEKAMQHVETIQRACCLYENHKIIAFYDGDIERRELTRVLKKELPAFMIPNIFYKVHGFPLTKNGKIDRQKLKSMMKEDCNV